MKITDVKTYIAGNPWKNWVFTRVETDEGIHGIGEATFNGFCQNGARRRIHELKRYVIGQDPFDVEQPRLRLFRDVYSDGGQIHGAALSGIEYACWDIMGKVTKQPVYKLLGGRCHNKLRVYANGWYRGPRTPESFHVKAKEVVAKGYTALKFDPFGAAWRIMEGLERFRADDGYHRRGARCGGPKSRHFGRRRTIVLACIGVADCRGHGEI